MVLKRALLAAAVCLLGASEVQAAWHEASSKHFVVYSDDAPDKVRAFTAKLERYDRALRVMRGVDDPAVSPTQRVTVYVLDDVGDIAKLYGRGVSGVAGFYDPRASGPVAFVPRHGDGGRFELTPQAILLHEYAHHFMYSNYGDTTFPPWFVEGFAEFNATAEFQPDGSVTFGNVPMYRLWGIASDGQMPARKLLSADSGRLTDEERQAMYGRGWLLTHYLMTDRDRQKQLNDYVRAVNAGKPAPEAAQALGDVKTLDRRLAVYTHQPLKGFKVPAERLTVGEVMLRALSPGEAAVMPARILSTRGVDAKSAPRIVALARKLAAPYPTDASAQNELAEAELDAGNPDASLAAADRALAADPRSMHALIYCGLAQQAIAAKAGVADPARWQTVRRAFVTANHADHDAPYPLELNYVSFIVAGQKPTANAEDGLLRAAALAPYDAGLGLIAAGVLLGRDQPDDARIVLKPIAYNPHGGDTAAVATKVLAQLDAGDKVGALALLSPKRDAAPTTKASSK